MPNSARSFLFRYGCAVVSIALATWVRLLLDPALGIQFPFATIFFAVLATAWYGGFRPALAAVVLGAVSASYFLIPPRGSLAVEGRDQEVGMVLYCGTSLGIAALGGLMHAARQQADAGILAERRQAALIDQTCDAMLVWEWNGPITFWNRGAERLYGFSRAEAVGRVSHELLRTQTSVGVSGFVRLLEQEGKWEGELHHTTRDGRSLVVETRMVLVRDGERAYVLEANRDITGRRRMEAELREANDQLEARVRERTAELAQINESLQVSEERFRLLIEGAQDYANFMLDPAGRVMTWNAGAERSKGYRAEEIIGRHFSCFYPEEDVARGKPRQELEQAVAEGRCQDEGWRVRKDGSRFWARVVITPLYDKTGQLRGFAKVTRDITEGMRAQERFRQAVESAPNGMVMINPEGKIILVNAQTEKLFGYRRDELLGQPVELLVPERFRNTHPAFRTGFFANPQVRSMGVGRELYGQRKDGSEFPVEIGLNPIKTDEGLMVLSSIVDITERKRITEAIAASEVRYRRLFEAAHDAILILDGASGKIIDSNPFLSGLLDYSADELLGKELWEIGLFQDIEASRTASRQLQEQGQIRYEDLPLKTKAGRSVSVEFVSNVYVEQGRQVIQCNIRDITERKLASEALQRVNAELERGLRHLGEANVELKAKTQENEAFVYSVSHDLRSPLVNLLGFSKELGLSVQDLRSVFLEKEVPQAVRDRGVGVLDGGVATSIRFIQTAVERLSNIIDALLRLSRAGRVIYKLQRVETQAVVARIVESLKFTTEQRGAAVQINELPPALGDPAAIEQVFANLIGNALNYLDKRRPGCIEIGAKDVDPSQATTGLQIYFVKDNGLGISDAGRSKIFQPFQRLHPKAAAGEGMGLAIIQRVVERHGGKIWFESAAGQGSCFFVALPMCPKEVSPAAETANSAAPEQGS
jgi:PAS domain S-box-containing protein